MKKAVAVIILALVVVCVCCIGGNKLKKVNTEPATVTTETTTTEPVIPPIEKFISSMTKEEKVGQLFIVNPEAVLHYEDEEKSPSDIKSVDEAQLETMKKYCVGGIIMFASNITDPEQIVSLNESIYNSLKIAPFICTDEEGGTVARIAKNYSFDVTRYDSMRSVGYTEDTEKAKEVGSTIGSYLKEYGFNLDLAPVCDLDYGNSAIRSRAFGSNPTLVGEMITAEIEGFHKAGMMCCAKHFPGHGSAGGDTHNGAANIYKDWDEMKETDIIPFEYAIDADVDMVMVGHLSTPEITDDDLPASLSHQMITGKLRNRLGFDGVIITDSFGMGAISDNYTSSYAAVTAIKAGADIVLMPRSFEDAYNAVLEAVESGEISEDELDEHVKRILTLKEKYKLVSFE